MEGTNRWRCKSPGQNGPHGAKNSRFLPTRHVLLRKILFAVTRCGKLNLNRNQKWRASVHWQAGKKSAGKRLTVKPEILIFDVDGVLVDVTGTYWRSALQTVQHLTGKRVTYAELHRWKAKPGYNDDWRMTADWATSVGRPTSYLQAQQAFNNFYWGTDTRTGNVRNEKLLVTPRQIASWAARYELNLFTGRNRKEFTFTFEKWPGTAYFRRVITMDDVRKIKPNPEGLYKILGKRDPATALYLGDNIDDALAAQAAGVPFIAILAPGEHGARARAKRFRELGALALLPRATALNAWLKRT
jgi:HAD superfamily phosphatase